MQLAETIQKYLSILDSDISEEEAIENLIASLDELAYLSHNVAYKPDDKDYPDPPERDRSKTLGEVRKRFSSLGFCNVAGEIGDRISECDGHIRDVTRYIAEIADNLSEVLWYLNNTSHDTALFYFKFDFVTHWGRHLRELQLYLHDRWWQSSTVHI